MNRQNDKNQTNRFENPYPGFQKTPYDWQFTYQWKPERGGGGIADGRMAFPMGKSLGGSTMLNWMAYVRGHSGDYDEWAELGNPGWAHEDVLPYFKKSQGAGRGLRGLG